MGTEIELIEKIKNHELGNKEDAKTLYDSLCDFLKEKYGPVDKDYDENPTKRGKEWLDIHHIREYELDDIAKRTDQAKGKLWFPLFSTMCTLEELKPYNVKEQLVYANKIEHFLLHYLIDSIRGQKIFSGGPNFLWDECVALDYYGFEKVYMNDIKSNKDVYYSIMSSEAITCLYKKLIDWKNWDIKQCARHWNTINYMIKYLDDKKVSYVEDKDVFFNLLDVVGYELSDEVKNKIVTLPFKDLIVEWNGQMTKIYNNHLFALDKKTAIIFNIHESHKSFNVPNYVERIADGAFRCGLCLETLTIPTTVKEIDSNVFVVECSGIYKGEFWPQMGPCVPVLLTENMERYFTSTWKGKCCKYLNTVIYKGTQQEWDEKFSNVDLDGVTLICKK